MTGTARSADGKHRLDFFPFPGDLRRFRLAGSLLGTVARQAAAEQRHELRGDHRIGRDPLRPTAQAAFSSQARSRVLARWRAFLAAS